MTYCIAMRLDAGLLFASDSRTNAGVDHIATFRKMSVFEAADERLVVLLSAGNLATTQSVVSLLRQRIGGETEHLLSCKSMYDVAELVGRTVKEIFARDSASETLGQGVDFGGSFIVGGQIKGEPTRLFRVYAQGNFIEAGDDTPYFQIGESKYGKPVLDRMIRPSTPLDQAAKCVLVSMDSTLKSNLSVGLPLDLAVYQANSLQSEQVVCIDEKNPYFQMIHSTWGEKLRQVFESLDDPQWAADGSAKAPLRVASARYEAMRKIGHPGEKLA